jgi:predicted nucleotidyltransferase
LTEVITSWSIPPTHVSLFGSVARGNATTSSDIDLLIVRPTTVFYDDEAWRSQLTGLTEEALLWTGQAIAWLELSDKELTQAVATTEPIVTEWRRDGVLLVGRELDDLLRTRAHRGE